MPDLLGFGASEKPEDHAYSILEQADLVEELWAREGVAAHDRRRARLLRDRGAGAAGATGGECADGGSGRSPPAQRRPVPGSAPPTAGPDCAGRPGAGSADQRSDDRSSSGRRRCSQRGAPGFDGGADAAEIGSAVTRGGGRTAPADRLYGRTSASTRTVGWARCEQTDVPLAFVWGMLDPISGAHVAQRIRERLPAAPLTRLEDVGHWPPLEAPGARGAALSASG